ncbi:right-handed parallel beta-helix repeat-containing protein [Zooshikella ganghwensis]|uniref:Right handed beta helix domain-containing protein n=1 Tax=Zooshikella ganghwensis TaxID=202772 RepID=A0A4P9VLT5_9GAMM|nr:right-handed parallel beta-helix repeat-containing protein [Zooshikella ganghwensis]RDH42842.1 hypothetical protein B9G39_04905 [Zooshikella ganghwensis]
MKITKNKTTSLLSALSLALTVNAYAADIVVDPTMEIVNIQTAINNAESGSTIKFNPGIYYLSSGFVIKKDNLQLLGEGAILRKVSGDNYTAIVVQSNYNVISGFTINGGKSEGKTIQGGGIFVYGSHNVISNVRVHNNTGHGIGLGGHIDDLPCGSNKVVNSRIFNNHMIGISEYNCSNNIITGNHVNDNGLEGITIDVGSHRNIVSDNRLHANCQRGGAGGIGIDQAEFNIIQGNIITASQKKCGGIKMNNRVGHSRYNVVNSNVILNNDGPGVWLSTYGEYRSNHNTLTGNVFSQNTISIKMDELSTNNVTVGNVIKQEVSEGESL